MAQRPPNDCQRSKLRQHIDVRQRHGNLSQQQYRVGQRLDVGQRSDVALLLHTILMLLIKIEWGSTLLRANVLMLVIALI